MTAPVLAHKKFYIIKPAEGTNQIANPIFSPPDYEDGWNVYGTSATKAESGDEQRFGAYSMEITPGGDGACGTFYSGLSVEDDLSYTFSAYIKAAEDTPMLIAIYASDGATLRAGNNFTATGYWQRVEVTWLATANTATERVYIARTSAGTGTEPFYVDGVQFEQASAATTLIEGYMPGCRWEGYARNSDSIRSAQYGLGGEIVDLEDYCHIVQVTGLGHGDWNQILTKMTSGGDMYQTHIRKSRQFSIIVDFIGTSLSEIENNRKAVLDLIRPDYLFGESEERRIIRYQGVDVNGDEATNPVDIVCVPLSASMVDTPDLPTYQRAVLNFSIPSGLLNGAYNEGAELDWIADFPAEYIVKRDPDGNWCEWGGSAYESLIPGMTGEVRCMAEGPDGKIYMGGLFTEAGGTTDADKLARWNPVSEVWEAVVAGVSASVYALAFDANGDLYVGGNFTNLGSTDGDYIVKITDLDGTPTVNAMGTGTNGYVRTIAISPNGDVYASGGFTLAGGVANTAKIAKWDGSVWSALATGLNEEVLSLAFAPSGDLYVGGAFTNATTDSLGDYLCYWDGTKFNRVGTVELTADGYVTSLEFDGSGNLYVGGAFSNAGGVTGADYIAKWNGSSWIALGTGTNETVYRIAYINSGRLVVAGFFTSAGGLTLTDRVAVWSNGAWQPLDINLPGTGTVYSILPASDGSLYIGGAFSTAGETPDENAECGIVSDRVYEIGVASASANTYPFMQVHGPGTLKSIANHSTGKTIAFDGLTLRPGEWINLFFDPLNLQFYGGWKGRGNLMRYIVPGSDYGDFYLMPGSNLLSLFMTDSTSDSGAFISWTPLFWGIDGALL